MKRVKIERAAQFNTQNPDQSLSALLSINGVTFESVFKPSSLADADRINFALEKLLQKSEPAGAWFSWADALGGIS
jgi:hypothetical protein